MSKSWLEKMDRPVVEISPMSDVQSPKSAEPVRGHYHFNKTAVPAKQSGDCLPGRRQHCWIGGRCWFCDKRRNKKR